MIITKTKQNYSLKQSKDSFKKSTGPIAKVGSISIEVCISQPSKKKFSDQNAQLGSCFPSAKLILSAKPEQLLSQSINSSIAHGDSHIYMSHGDTQYKQENHRLVNYLRKNLWDSLISSTLRTDDTLASDIRSTKLANNVGSYFYLKDSLGSIVDITNESGQIVQHNVYSSFGELLKITNDAGDEITPVVRLIFNYTNREYDKETKLMFYRARVYLPKIGRFLQEDPNSGDISEPNTFLSKYVYVNNNPINMFDPSGEVADWVAHLVSFAGQSYDSYEDSDGQNITIGFNVNYDGDGNYQSTDYYAGQGGHYIYYNTSPEAQSYGVSFDNWSNYMAQPQGIDSVYIEFFFIRSTGVDFWFRKYPSGGLGIGFDNLRSGKNIIRFNYNSFKQKSGKPGVDGKMVTKPNISSEEYKFHHWPWNRKR